MHDAMRPMGGSFLYGQVMDEGTLVVDPDAPPHDATQSQLRNEVERYQAYFDMDLHFCRAVEGASQESNLWVARNSDASGLSDVDLQRFKNIAWNECVVKRFLPTQDGNVMDVGRSMLQIVRNLNLQWRGFEVMGLHPKVEAAEKQIVMLCMEKRLLAHDLDVGRIARCLRRCPHFRDHFSNAVGCHIVAKTGHTPGLSKTQYNTDLDYVYKNQGLYFFESALKRNRSLASECIMAGSPLEIDYIPRLCGLKLVSRGDVLLQNPPEKPGTPVVVRGGSFQGGALASDGGNDVAARLISDSMEMFRADMREIMSKVDFRNVRRKFDEMMEQIQTVTGRQVEVMMDMQAIADRISRPRRRSGSPLRDVPVDSPSAAPPLAYVPGGPAATRPAVPPPRGGSVAPPPAVPPPRGGSVAPPPAVPPPRGGSVAPPPAAPVRPTSAPSSVVPAPPPPAVPARPGSAPVVSVLPVPAPPAATVPPAVRRVLTRGVAPVDPTGSVPALSRPSSFISSTDPAVEDIISSSAPVATDILGDMDTLIQRFDQ